MKPTLTDLCKALINQIELSHYHHGDVILDTPEEKVMSMDHDLKLNKAYQDLKKHIDENTDEAGIRAELQVHMDYEFLSGAYNELKVSLEDVQKARKHAANMFNEVLIAKQKEIESDMKALTPIVKFLGYEIVDHMIARYGLNVKFLKRPEPPKPASMIVAP